MNKIIPIALTLGCIGAGAATSNYDLLGRKGSQMNSPMVYRNVDYSKVKKDEQQKVGPSLEAHSLQKMGMPDDIKAIEGAYTSNQSWSYRNARGQDISNAHYFFRRHYASNSENCYSNSSSTHFCVYNWPEYRTASNDAFIDIDERQSVSPNYVTAGWSNASSFSKENPSYLYLWRSSPYVPGENIQYTDFDVVKRGGQYSGANNVGPWSIGSDWYDGSASYVGVFLQASAVPVKLAEGKTVQYVRTNNRDSFSPTVPEYEIMAARSYGLVKDASRRSVVYVGRNSPSNPASHVPQIYMGVRNDKNLVTANYEWTAKTLDNYIYDNRTLEFVPAGNYGAEGGLLSFSGHSANAVTVGAIDPYSMNVANYTSSVTHTGGSQKPEIYNFTNTYNMESDHVEYTRHYTYGGHPYDYPPFYDGTEMAAAYTAGMVSNLLATNPFYRWHPEVVKALLLSSQGANLNSYPNRYGATSAPAYDFLVFNNLNPDNGFNNFNYYSRYWNGDITKLKTRTENGKHEIWFVTSNLGYSRAGLPGHLTTAAISWLSSGNDIGRTGAIPQDFDLTIYGSDNSDYACLNDPNIDLKNPPSCNGHAVNFNFSNPGEFIGSSTSSNNAYERKSFSTPYRYLVFKIKLYSEDAQSENRGQVVLGFNLSARRYY
ncbi:MAG: hypothetical protein IK012_06175 [Fibrobacter sp.]|uniref:hypothetical protein n=1 Tax=Fibrobacter sp. TaxID=35828 RepID=UPI0025BC14FA|nr:hypothetical protein [Fibrobacter sp.]MBR4784825.1 hypothetical protein [Fibrobacter sp.]